MKTFSAWSLCVSKFEKTTFVLQGGSPLPKPRLLLENSCLGHGRVAILFENGDSDLKPWVSRGAGFSERRMTVMVIERSIMSLRLIRLFHCVGLRRGLKRNMASLYDCVSQTVIKQTHQ